MKKRSSDDNLFKKEINTVEICFKCSCFNIYFRYKNSRKNAKYLGVYYSMGGYVIPKKG